MDSKQARELETRVEELEIRLAFQDDLIRQLDEVVREQAERVQALQASFDELRSQIAEEEQGPFKIGEEIPPHY